MKIIDQHIKPFARKYFLPISSILGVGFAGFVYYASRYSENGTAIGAIQNTIYYLTLVVLVWYSFETRQMRINQFRPFVSAFLRTPKGSPVSFLILKNIGAGPAHQVVLRLIGHTENGGKREPLDTTAAIGTIDRDMEFQVSDIGDQPTERAIVDSVLSMSKDGDLHIKYVDLNDTEWCGHYRKIGKELVLISAGRV